MTANKPDYQKKSEERKKKWIQKRSNRSYILNQHPTDISLGVHRVVISINLHTR